MSIRNPRLKRLQGLYSLLLVAALLLPQQTMTTYGRDSYAPNARTSRPMLPVDPTVAIQINCVLNGRTAMAAPPTTMSIAKRSTPPIGVIPLPR
ncbi:MAG: hypothetical protein R2932_53245 [Caldilineaceae bacterium]